jgi:hypothetical protein
MIDKAGNITLNRAEDAFLPFDWEISDGVFVDISASDIRFIVSESFTLVPGVDPDDDNTRILHFTTAHAAQLGTRVHEYVLKIVADGVHKILCAGTIRAEGFVA